MKYAGQNTGRSASFGHHQDITEEQQGLRGLDLGLGVAGSLAPLVDRGDPADAVALELLGPIRIVDDDPGIDVQVDLLHEVPLQVMDPHRAATVASREDLVRRDRDELERAARIPREPGKSCANAE